jgi:hypothetical protein
LVIQLRRRIVPPANPPIPLAIENVAHLWRSRHGIWYVRLIVPQSVRAASKLAGRDPTFNKNLR